ncbi:mitochondrial fission factor-like isoform X1 [Sphaeramia orbicularis]|uniref:mitochondrial fission factor-like isoform X1 n=1 Tax=Sphaeramia orbicularis TaxID=375764 RepID=UPI0011816F47|nr:mitochondrial fission factor-like isoform X1 [Sphaeramia orbicularis]XP_030010193.1 mitochondrial fission factor-like isoform X1 [Sphaeramia orbicularis]
MTTMYPVEMSHVPGRDPAFMEAIDKNMRVPERLSMGPEQHDDGEATRRWNEPPPAYTMQVPDRLTYTEAPDMSPRPLFGPARLTPSGPAGLEPCWETSSGEVFYRDTLQCPIRRSLSDQSFGRTPPGTPTQLKQGMVVPRHPSSSRGSDHPLHRRSPVVAVDPQVQPQPQAPPAAPLSLLSPQSVLQAARHMGLQASQRLLQTINNRYRFNRQERPPLPPAAAAAAEARPPANVEYSNKRAMESWSPEEEGSGAVEFIVLRRQVMKMNRRLAALERHNLERRNTEVVLFSLLISACLLNAWLWIRR